VIKITRQEFSKLSQYIHQNYGIHIKEEKQMILASRLYNELLNNNCKSFTQYFEYIKSDKSGRAIAALINKITTNHTFFMREADHFYFFRDTVLPYISSKVKNKDLRIWSTGCSTGQEPYTLAMLIDEYFKDDKYLWDTRILATDISNRVLCEAKKGIYNSDQIQTLPAIWRLNYFQKLNNGCFVITDRIKKEVIFRNFNLMEKEFPFKKRFHVIFCRNVMIYFDYKTKVNLVNKFYDYIEYGGYLFVGHTESLPRYETKFQYVQPAVYRKV